MKKEDLKNIVTSKYDREKFELLIAKIFNKSCFYNEKKQLNSENNSNGFLNGYRLGEYEFKNSTKIGIFEFEVDKVLERNRVSLQKELLKQSDGYFFDALFGVYFNKNEKKWRWSLIVIDYIDKEHIKTLNRYTYLMGKGVKSRTAIDQISKLLTKNIENISDILEGFSVETVTKEFFEGYKKLFDKFNQHSYKNIENYKSIFNEGGEKLKKLIRDFNKKLLGRLVFLKFLEKKEWLGANDQNYKDGDSNFLYNLFKLSEDKGLSYYNECLAPLFYETLNNSENRLYKITNSFIPFLNGGLFEKECKDKSVFYYPNSLFKELFELFNRYNFTIIENDLTDKEIAVDPEMLGHIFENLLEDNKDKGAFYTPKEIVDYMAKSSILEYLKNFYKGESEHEALEDLVFYPEVGEGHFIFIDKNRDKLLKLLNEVKILDPAIGSGAFPVGILHVILQLKESLSDYNINRAEEKRKIIENSIYGVDIDKGAVDIARLRFWLSLIVDQDKPIPLPNLDFKIVTGNSLIKLDGKDKKNGYRLFEPEEVGELKDIRLKFFKASGDEKYKLEEKYFEKREILIKKFSKSGDTFSENSKKIMDWDPFYGTSTDFFDPEWMFGIKDGFDIVIGNPPYIRQEKIKDLKPILKKLKYKTFTGTADIYIYFYEMGVENLKKGGNLTFITSNKYTRAKYGKNFRKYLLDNSSILQYIDFNGVRVFENATVDTSILITKKDKFKKDNKLIYCSIDEKYKKNDKLKLFVENNGFQYDQNDLTEDSFSFLSIDELKIKKDIEKIGTPLKEWDININYGIKTGYNEAFIIDTEKKDQILSNCKDEEELKRTKEVIKPVLRGRDIKRYSYKWADLWLINFHNNPPLDIKKYPALKNYLDQHYDKLNKRYDKGKTPYNLRNCAYLKEFEKEKIFWKAVGRNLAFSLITDSIYLTAPASFISSDRCKYLIAIILSNLGYYYIINNSDSTGAGDLMLNIQSLEKLPIPKISLNDQKPFEYMVDFIIFSKENNKEKESLLFESVVDGMVFDLYFEDSMKKHDVYITDRVKEKIEPFDIDESKEDKIKYIDALYNFFKKDKIIQRCLIYRRVVKEVQIISGVNNGEN